MKQALDSVAEVAGYLWQKGWAERNGGNLTLNITEFADEQMLYNARLSEAVDFNNNIKKSEMARARISKATTKADLVDAAADCIEALTNDKTIRAKLETLKDGDGA